MRDKGVFSVFKRLMGNFDHILRKGAVCLIRIYQFLFQSMPRSCRYQPTCSEYSLAAFKKYSFLKAFALSCIRILKCNPLFPGGSDPLK